MNLPNRPCKLAKKPKSLNKSGKAHFCMSNISTFTNTTYSPVLTLYLCYRVLNLGRVATF